MPEFLVIGAAKSGTTSVDRYLAEHPAIFMSPVKEPGFFAFEGDKMQFSGPRDAWMLETVRTTWPRYLELFEAAQSYHHVGETSPVYLYDEDAPSRIKTRLPEAKLIALLRNPVDRALSQFRFMIQCEREPESNLMDALLDEDRRVEAGWEWGWHYRRLGFYGQQMERYYALFDADQIHVELYDDLIANAEAVMQRIFHFLDVDISFQPNVQQLHNATRLDTSRRFSRFLNRTGLRAAARAVTTRRFRRWAHARPFMRTESDVFAAMDAETRRFLRGHFRTDIQHLEDLIGRDLDHWLTPDNKRA